MKKLTVATMVALMTIGYTNSNAQAFEEGKSYASIGYGVGTLSKSLYSAYETYTDFKYTEIGPIYAKYEYAVGEKFGIGVHIAYKSGLAKYTYTEGADNFVQSMNSSSLSIFGRFNWHFGDHEI